MSHPRPGAVKPSPALFLLALVAVIGASCLASARADAAIPPGGVLAEEVSLEWVGNPEMQSVPFFGGSNYFSAGRSDGTEATYSSLDGDAAVFQVSKAGDEKLATYGTRAEHTTSGGRQVVRLYGGEGRINEGEVGAIAWQGSFTVNFYGGKVPFTFEDPEIYFGGDGTGTLSATLLGCASSQADPNECAALEPRNGVTFATFENVKVDPTGELTIQPSYEGVEVETPPNAAKQNRETPGWGAWPQEFVNFQFETGLSSYWYSSGSVTDSKKKPLPFTLNFEGGEPPAVEPTDPGSETPGGGEKPTEDAPSTQPTTSPADTPSPTPGSSPAPAGTSPAGAPVEAPRSAPAQIVLLGGSRDLDARGFANVATITCPTSAPAPCRPIVPRRTAVKIGGKRYLVAVFAPKTVMPGKSAKVRVRLPEGALDALGDDTLVLRIPIVVDPGPEPKRELAKVKVAG